MSDLSIFVDESGELGTESRRYLVCLVFHDQAIPIDDQLRRYRDALAQSGLSPCTLHFGPLLNGHEGYENMDVATRKRYLSKFMVFAQHIPFRYAVLSYRKDEFDSAGKLMNRIRRDITNLLFDNIAYLQAFDKVKLYYDGGQGALANVLDAALRYVIANDALVEKDASTERYILLQLADFLCGLEFTHIKFAAHEETVTDRLFFGTPSNLKRAYEKKFKKNRLEQ